jgi:hypothetical protein
MAATEANFSSSPYNSNLLDQETNLLPTQKDVYKKNESCDMCRYVLVVQQKLNLVFFVRLHIMLSGNRKNVFFLL